MYEDIIKPGLVLFVITVVASAILAVANGITAPIIEKNNLAAKNTAMAELLTGVIDNKFGDDVLTGGEMGVTAYNIGYAGENVYGYAVSVAVKGYGGVINMLVGIKADGTIEGVSIINHDETPGLGANANNPKFTGQYIGKKGLLSVTKSAALSDNQIEAVTSATITSKAITDGVNLATEYYKTVLSKEGVK